MIDLYYWTTPNGHKLTILLEEIGLPYRILPINISQGQQFGKAFLEISPNNRIPALVDHAPSDAGAPIAIFESGAMMIYLADKTRQFLPQDIRIRQRVVQWLFWQMSGLGPMAGQNHHFTHYAPERIEYATKRYIDETTRLYGVLNRQLALTGAFVAGEYSIADMATYPWCKLWERQKQDLSQFPHLERWLKHVSDRPAVQRAYEIAAEINQVPTVTEDSKRYLFGQTAPGFGSRT